MDGFDVFVEKSFEYIIEGNWKGFVGLFVTFATVIGFSLYKRNKLFAFMEKKLSGFLDGVVDDISRANSKALFNHFSNYYITSWKLKLYELKYYYGDNYDSDIKKKITEEIESHSHILFGELHEHLDMFTNDKKRLGKFIKQNRLFFVDMKLHFINEFFDGSRDTIIPYIRRSLKLKQSSFVEFLDGEEKEDKNVSPDS